MKSKFEKFSREELVAELKKRDETDKQTDDIPCVGIVDNEGLDSLIEVENADHFATLTNSMELRCHFNSQRNPELFFIKVPRKLYEMFKNGMNQSEETCVNAGKAVRELSNYKILLK